MSTLSLHQQHRGRRKEQKKREGGRKHGSSRDDEEEEGRGLDSGLELLPAGLEVPQTVVVGLSRGLNATVLLRLQRAGCRRLDSSSLADGSPGQ